MFKHQKQKGAKSNLGDIGRIPVCGANNGSRWGQNFVKYGLN